MKETVQNLYLNIKILPVKEEERRNIKKEDYEHEVTVGIKNFFNLLLLPRDVMLVAVGVIKYESDLHVASEAINNVKSAIANGFAAAEMHITAKQNEIVSAENQHASFANKYNQLSNERSSNQSTLYTVQLELQSLNENISSYSTQRNAIQHNIAQCASSTDATFKNMTPKQHSFLLFKSIAEGFNEMITMLLNLNKFDENYQNKEGETLVHYVVKIGYNHDQFLKKILSKKPDLSICNKDGNSPLYEALKLGKKDLSHELISCVQPLDILKEVMDKDAMDIMKFLISVRPDWLNYKDGSGNTILGLALQNNKMKVADMLLSLGADFSSALTLVTNINLSGVTIKPTHVDGIIKKLQSDNKLTQLSLNNTKLNADGMNKILDALSQYHNLESIDLSNNNICGSVQNLSNAFKSNSGIKNVALSNVGIHGNSKQVFENMKQCSNISNLDVSSNNLGYDGAVSLSNVLSSLSLQKLNVANINVDYRSIKAISDALEKNGSIETINLANNNFEDSGAAIFYNVLENNQRILILNLGGIGVSDSGVTLLCDRLINNFIVVSLDLSKNVFQHHGAEAIEYLLSQCKSLVHIDLSGNKILESKGDELSKSLDSNNTLLQFVLDEKLNTLTSDKIQNNNKKFANMISMLRAKNNEQIIVNTLEELFIVFKQIQYKSISEGVNASSYYTKIHNCVNNYPDLYQDECGRELLAQVEIL